MRLFRAIRVQVPGPACFAFAGFRGNFAGLVVKPNRTLTVYLVADTPGHGQVLMAHPKQSAT